jgi:hypothetical protein
MDSKGWSVNLASWGTRHKHIRVLPLEFFLNIGCIEALTQKRCSLRQGAKCKTQLTKEMKQNTSSGNI